MKYQAYLKYKTRFVSKLKNVDFFSGGLVFCLSAILSYTFLHSPGTSDVSIWMRWISAMQEYGVTGGYAISQSDYPPLSFALLGGVKWFSALFGADIFVTLKGSLFLFLLLTSLTVVLWSRNWMLGAALHTMLLFNAMGLAYLDMYYALPLLLSVWALHKNKPLLFVFLFTISVFIKWQPVVLGPFFALYLWRNYKDDWKRYIWHKHAKYVSAFFLFSLFVLLWYFGFSQVLESFRRAGDHYYISANALNLGWLLEATPLVAKELVDIRIIAALQKLLFGFMFMYLLYRFFRDEKKNLAQCISYCLLAYLSYFMLSSGVHENHMFIPVLLSCIGVILSRVSHTDFFFIGLFNVVNLVSIYGIDGRSWNIQLVEHVDTYILFAFLGVVFYIFFLIKTLVNNNAGLDTYE